MSDFYADNLSSFAKRHAEMAAFVDSLDTNNYQVFTATSGEPALRVTLLNGGSVLVGSEHDPRAEARALIPDLSGDHHMFVLMGVGLGYLLFEILQRYPKSRVLVIEQDSRLFKSALKSFDYSKIFADPRVDFIVSLKPERLLLQFCSFFARNGNDLYLPAVRVVKDDAVVKLSQDYYVAAAKMFNHAVAHYWDIYVGDSYTDALTGLRHVLTNLKQLERMMTLEPYLERFKNATGIVVSSGPSLDGSLEFLRCVQDKAFLVCADSALKKLLANGIKPFGVSCLERDQVNIKYFKDFEIPSDVILFAPPLIKPEIVEHYPGPISVFFRHSYPFAALPPLSPCYNVGTSCAHLSYQVLNLLGCQRIALVGQDLAYDRESNASHFNGVLDDAVNQYAPLPRIPVPDNMGGVISSGKDWIQFRDFFEDFIAANRNRHEVFHVIPKERGLAIKGAKRVDPDVFFAELKSGPARPNFDVTEGLSCMRDKAPGFKFELATERELLSRTIPKLATSWQELANVSNAAEYFARKAQIIDGLDTQTRYLFGELIKPHIKRFDAHATSLWSEVEFCEQLPAFLELSAKLISDLEEVWEGEG